MTHQQAAAVFSREGENVGTMAPDAIKKAWIRLQRKYHEAGAAPDLAKLADINAAYAVLKNGPAAAQPDAPPAPGAAAADGRPRNQGREAFAVWGWDGERLAKLFTAEAAADDLAGLAAQAARDGHGGQRALFAQAASNRWDLLLFQLDGRAVDPPRTFPQGSGDGNAAADKAFLASLPRKLGLGGGGAQAETPAEEAARLQAMRDRLKASGAASEQKRGLFARMLGR